MAAAYAYRIANAHAFVDGNKRAAYLACWNFVCMNVWDPVPPARPVGLEHAIMLASSGAATDGLIAAVIVKALGGRDVPIE